MNREAQTTFRLALLAIIGHVDDARTLASAVPDPKSRSYIEEELGRIQATAHRLLGFIDDESNVAEASS